MNKTTIELIHKLYKAGLAIPLLLMGLGVFSQAPRVTTTINRENILIGEHIQYKVEVLLSAGAVRLKWFIIPDSIQHFEVVERSKIDSSESDGRIRISQVITLTSFDSGQNVIPAFEMGIEPSEGDSSLIFFTDSLKVNVSFSPMDSTKTFHDIKSIIEVSDKWPWWMWALIIASVILIVFLIIYFIKVVARKRQERALYKSNLSPYDEALEALKALEKQKLLMNGEVKKYHTTLSQVFRRFVSRKLRQNMMNMTSAEMLVKLNPDMSSEFTSALAAVLRMGDAVKFAKYIPPVVESEAAVAQLRRVIERIDQIDNTQNQAS
jgi:hypothetical protein